MKLVSIAAVAFLYVLASSMAQAPGMINYQGRLVSNGVPAEGVVNLNFKLYTTSGGVSPVYSFTTNSVPIANGLYSVMIGNTNSADLLTVLTNSSLYLEVWAYGTNLSPRTQLASVPYALKAEGLIGSGATNWIDRTTFNGTNALKVDTITFNNTNALKTDVSVFNTTNALKVDITTFDATNTALQGQIDNRVTITTFNNTNALKVDATAFDATNTALQGQIDNRVTITTFNNTNALKVDITTFDATNAVLQGQIDNRVTITTFNNTNALKVDTITFNNTNALKTDVSVFNTTNALKVDITTFNATNDLKLDKAGGVLTGEIIISNNVTISSNLYVLGFITNAAYYGNGIGITNLSGSTIIGNIPLAAMTNGFGATNLYTGTYTNMSTLITNVVEVKNGVIVSVITTSP